jgi:hypothetical protein
VLVHHDSSAAPQTVQSASPVRGTKNFVSVRLYSAPQLHWTTVSISRNMSLRRGRSSHNQTDPLPLIGIVPCEADGTI